MKKINSLFLILLFSNMFLMVILLEPSTIQTTISKETDQSEIDLLFPDYQDERIIELGNWKEKLGNFDSILVSDSIAYVSGGDNTLAIVNFTDLNSIEIIGKLDTAASFSTHINLDNDYLVISEGPRGFEVIDISNKSDPIDIFYKYHPSTQETVFYNQYLIVADMDVDLRIFNADNKSDLTQISYISDGTQGAYSIEIKDHYALVADGHEGLEIFDIQDIFNPIEIGEYSLTNGSYFTDVVVENDTAYVLNDESSLIVFNISEIENPTVLGIYNGSNYQSITVENNFAYLTGPGIDIDILNCSNPTNITLISSYESSGNFRDIQVNGETLYVGDGINGFTILNTTDFSNITITAQFGGGHFREMVVSSGYAYLLDYLGYLVVLDISDYNNVKKTGSFNFPSYTYGLFVEDDILFVTAWSSGLYILNSTNKHELELISNYNGGGNTTDVFVVEDKAYVTDYEYGLLILDVSSLASPTNITTISLDEGPASIYIESDNAYITTLGDIIYRININEYSPTYAIAVIIYLGKSCEDILKLNDYCFFATYTLTIYEETDEVISFSDEINTGTVLDLELINNNYLLTSGITSIQIFDISMPAYVYPRAAFYDMGIIEDISYDDGNVYLLNSENQYDLEITVFDSDSDGLLDYEELYYGTDMFNEDSDYDNLNDYDEVIIYETNPFEQDTDADGLLDGEEVNLYRTDPKNVDTDGDGHTDYEEVLEETDPLNPFSFPIKRTWVVYVVIISAFVIIAGFLLLRIRKNIK
ncbi:MAG: hypothetical protein FK733_08375 [Asgard group archaeon]|nr:hypothetical protein [Asgard group archaeon]